MARIAKHKKLPPRDERLPAQAYSPEGYRYALVRIALPENKTRPDLPPRYYRPDATDGVPWVVTGYKVWPIEEWSATYGREYKNDVRNWEFFGEEIDIWEGYSDE